MKQVLTLEAQKREGLGTRASRRMRRTGLVPGILYGHKQAAVPIAVSHEALESALRHRTRMLDLSLEGKAERVLLSEVQYDSFGKDIVHADFIRVAMDELVRIKVPVVLKGKAKGEQHGAVTEQLLTEVEVECLPADIPESIPLIVADLDVGDSVKVSDLKAPDKVKIVTDPTYLVVTVAALKKEVEVAPAAAAVVVAGPEEPEVIARGKVEEEGEAPEEEGQEKGKEKAKEKEKK
jgi:large subunit ribosomal protein L25